MRGRVEPDVGVAVRVVVALLVLVGVLGGRQGVEVLGEVEHRHAVRLHGLEHVVDRRFEAQPVGDHEVGRVQVAPPGGPTARRRGGPARAP